MSAFQGRFVWYELMSPDAEAAKAFYGKVVGWGTRPAPVPGTDYTLFTAGDVPVCGVMDLKACGEGGQPGWLGYVGVADVDAAADQARRLGATIRMPPTDIPNVGRFAVLTDSQGAAIALFRGTDPTQDQPPDQMAPGRVGWHELATTDREASLAFHTALFGWGKGEAMEMGGPVGTYQIVTLGTHMLGGIFAKTPEMPGPMWTYYINVPSIDAAIARVTEGGGRVLLGPMEVPGGMWIIQATDPQGVMFALVGPRA